jgi:GT2 family glycosyltransferase
MNAETIHLADVPNEPRPVLEDISVVIPTLGRPILESALAWIAAGDAWPARLIVVDQSSSAQVRGWLDSLEARGLSTLWVASDERGRSAGVNRGLERVETRFVAVTDDDCFVEEDWLRRMRDQLAGDPGTIVSGRVEGGGSETVVAVVTDADARVQRKPSLKFDTMSGGNMGTSKDVVDRVGPFDEDPSLSTAEDCDWSYRALRAGVPIVYAPQVGLLHYGWRDEQQRSSVYRSYAQSHGGFYGKYLRKGDWFIALRAGVHFLRALKRLLRGALTGDTDRVARGWAYLVGLPRGIAAGLRRREAR